MGRTLQVICGVVLAVGLLGASQQPESPSESEAAGQGQGQAGGQKEIREGFATLTGAVEQATAKQPTAEERNQAQRDLKAQERMAGWAVWVGIFAAAQAVISAGGLWYIRKTLLASNEAVDQASKSTQAVNQSLIHAQNSEKTTLRPYVTASPARKFEGHIMAGFKPKLTVVFDNMGQTPVRRFICHWALSVEIREQIPLPAQLQSADQFFAEHLDEGVSFSRQYPYVKTATEPLTREEVSDLHAGKCVLAVWGAAYYKDIFGQNHRTTICFYVPGSDLEGIPQTDPKRNHAD